MKPSPGLPERFDEAPEIDPLLLRFNEEPLNYTTSPASASELVRRDRVEATGQPLVAGNLVFLYSAAGLMSFGSAFVSWGSIGKLRNPADIFALDPRELFAVQKNFPPLCGVSGIDVGITTVPYQLSSALTVLGVAICICNLLKWTSIPSRCCSAALLSSLFLTSVALVAYFSVGQPGIGCWLTFGATCMAYTTFRRHRHPDPLPK